MCTSESLCVCVCVFEVDGGCLSWLNYILKNFENKLSDCILLWFLLMCGLRLFVCRVLFFNLSFRYCRAWREHKSALVWCGYVCAWPKDVQGMRRSANEIALIAKQTVCVNGNPKFMSSKQAGKSEKSESSSFNEDKQANQDKVNTHPHTHPHTHTRIHYKYNQQRHTLSKVQVCVWVYMRVCGSVWNRNYVNWWYHVGKKTFHTQKFHSFHFFFRLLAEEYESDQKGFWKRKGFSWWKMIFSKLTRTFKDNQPPNHTHQPNQPVSQPTSQPSWTEQKVLSLHNCRSAIFRSALSCSDQNRTGKIGSSPSF